MRNLLLIIIPVVIIWIILSVVLIARKIILKSRVGKFENTVLRIVYAVNFLICALLMYGFFIEPQLLEVTRYTIETRKVDASGSIRIAQISDIHAPGSKWIWQKVEAELSAPDIDLIVFTGDLARDNRSYTVAMTIFRRLSAIAPVYAIRGNADNLPIGNYFAAGNTTELDGESFKLTVHDIPINLVGSSTTGGYAKLYSVFRNLNSDYYTVYLGHSPDYLDDLAKWGTDLYLAGHTHGGQISLPYYGAVWTGSLYGKKYERGFYTLDNTLMYINRGLGMADKFPPVRIGSRPELTVIDIVGTQ